MRIKFRRTVYAEAVIALNIPCGHFFRTYHQQSSPVPAMKSPLLAALALMVTPVMGATEAAMPPDPLMQRLVPVPFTAAELVVRSKTEAPGLNLWRLAGELDKMSTAQVRTVAFNCWRPYRRFEASGLYAATLALSLWAGRDLADAAGTVMFNGSWEDMDEFIADDYDLDLESEAAWLWAQLAARDWKKAAVLLRNLSGEESSGQFISMAVEFAKLNSSQATEFIAIIAPKPMAGSREHLENAAEILAEKIAATQGLKSTGAWAKSLKSKIARSAARMRVSKWEAPPTSPSPSPAFGDDPLGKLRALDVDGKWIMPFPLYRAVKALPPAEAIKLADEAVAHPLEREGTWLRWMLFARAAEGDPVAAARLVCGPPIDDVALPLTEVFAWRKDVTAAVGEIGRMPDKMEREAALTGLSYHVDLTTPAQWLASVAQLNASASSAAPMFARLGAAGRGREAWELAATVDDESAADHLASIALTTWILTDVRGFFRFLKEKGDADGNGLTLKSDSINVEDAIDQLRSLGARELLLDDDPVPPKYLGWSDHIRFFAYEDRDLTFRYLERHGDDPDYEFLISSFTDVAVRFEPERAVALSSRAVAARLARDRKLKVEPDENGESELENDRWAFGAVRRRLVQFWPEKALALAAPVTDREWEVLCGDVLEQHPGRLAKLMKGAPETVRKSLAKLLTATDGTRQELRLSAEKRKEIADYLRAWK